MPAAALRDPAPVRDDDPVHENLDGIMFKATTDRQGVVCTPETAQVNPPMTYIQAELAVEIASDIDGVIGRVRKADPDSYLATFLDVMLADFMAAIAACHPDKRP